MRKQHYGELHIPTLVDLLSAPINPKQTRRILEVRSPISLFVEVDEKEQYHILGLPNVPGHFQVGTLLKQMEWTPSQNQNVLRWETKPEQNGYLHLVHRDERMSLEECIALVQHEPMYTSKKGSYLLKEINRVLVSPLWDTKTARIYCQAKHTYRSILMRPCSCDMYLSLQQTFAYQSGQRQR